MAGESSLTVRIEKLMKVYLRASNIESEATVAAVVEALRAGISPDKCIAQISSASRDSLPARIVSRAIATIAEQAHADGGE